MKISLAIIVMNEMEAVRELFPRIPLEVVDETVVVDGNSTDGTAEFFRQRGLRVVTQKVRGLGAAMLTAREAVSGEAMIFFHPDGNEDPAEITKFRRFLEEGFDLVIPSRMLGESFNEEDDQVFRPRKWANLGLALIANVLWRREGPFVTDMTQGFRAITCEAFDRMKLDELGCAMDYQMIIRALKGRMKTFEFPTREGRRISGEIKMKSFPTGIRNLKIAWNEILRGQRVFKDSGGVPLLDAVECETKT